MLQESLIILKIEGSKFFGFNIWTHTTFNHETYNIQINPLEVKISLEANVSYS